MPKCQSPLGIHPLKEPSSPWCLLPRGTGPPPPRRRHKSTYLVSIEADGAMIRGLKVDEYSAVQGARDDLLLAAVECDGSDWPLVPLEGLLQAWVAVLSAARPKLGGQHSLVNFRGGICWGNRDPQLCAPSKWIEADEKPALLGVSSPLEEIFSD